MGTGNSKTGPGDAFFIMVSGVPSIITGLRVVGCTLSSSTMTQEKRISIHTAHITKSSN
jgi:hypothetical protein